jgi:hypothetical protein
LIQLAGADVNAATITQTLQQVEIAPSDSVLFYYSGHGGFSPTQGHYLAVSNGQKLYRSSLERAITTPYRPKFWAMITDCCASAPQSVGAPAAAASPASKTLLTELFLNTQGRVDITSSRPQQVSVGGFSGGLFTNSLCEVLRENSHQRLSWNAVFRAARASASRIFEEAMEASDREPYRHRGVNGTRLGIFHNNLVVSQVVGQSPASGWLSPGTQIYAVNGQQIADDNHLKTAINFSGRVARLTVVTPSGLQTRNVQLAY